MVRVLRSKVDKSIHFAVTPIIRTNAVTTGKIKAAIKYHFMFPLILGLKPKSFQLSYENIVITTAINIGDTNHIPMPGESPSGCSGRVESTRTPIQPLRRTRIINMTVLRKTFLSK